MIRTHNKQIRHKHSTHTHSCYCSRGTMCQTVTYPACFFTLTQTVWASKCQVYNLPMGSWGLSVFHASVCEEEAFDIIEQRLTPRLVRNSCIIYGMGHDAYLRSKGFSEEQIGCVKTILREARKDGPQGVQITFL